MTRDSATDAVFTQLVDVWRRALELGKVPELAAVLRQLRDRGYRVTCVTSLPRGRPP